MVVVVGEGEPRPDFASPGSARPSRGELKRDPRRDTALNNAQPALVWRGRPRRPSHPSVLARVAGGLLWPGLPFTDWSGRWAPLDSRTGAQIR